MNYINRNPFAKSELEVLEEEFGAGDDPDLSRVDADYDDDYGGDEEFKAYQRELLRNDPYMSEIYRVQDERRRNPIEMIDIDLLS